MLFKRFRFFALAGLIVFGLITYVLSREKTSIAPPTIYKKVTPAPAPQPLQTQPVVEEPPKTQEGSHNASDADSSRETSENYDWQNESGGSSQPKADPWKNIAVQEEGSETNGTYPPPNWHQTQDPVLRAEYYGAQMLKQFGDIPEVHTVSEWELKKAMRITPTHDELINYLEALYHLFPREATRRSLENHRELRAKGIEVKMVPEGDTQ